MTIVKRLKLLFVSVLFFPLPVWAGGTGSGYPMPWDPILDALSSNISTNVLGAAAVIAIVLTGILFAFTSAEQGMRKAVGVVFGLSAAFGAVLLIDTLFSLAGATV